MATESFINPVTDDESWQAALAEERAFVYKHSPICHLSAMAFRELQKFVQTDNETPIYMVDVLSNRAISNQIENELGVRHESPQIFLLSEGKTSWYDSHWGIKADTMLAQVSKLR